MNRAALLFNFALLLPLTGALRLDQLARANNRTVQDSQLAELIETSIEWLQFRASYFNYPLLSNYTSQLQRVLRPSCKHCFDYFEAVALIRSLGKLVNRILQDDKNDVHFPVIRRSYVAAIWVLQRSRMFAWQTSSLQSNVLSTMYRIYLQHVNRAKGRTVSFHHISKCGGTTMCQLAVSNRCSNPATDQEKNCVLSSRLDGPLWMVAHDVTQDGPLKNNTIGMLDQPIRSLNVANMSLADRITASRHYATEPELPMWLMYSCPYSPNGRTYTCKGRATHAQDSRSTFVANERALSREFGITQVCPDFLNAVILREPVPHVVSLMAEVKFRYVRQLMLRHNITSWQPPGWNLTWWEELGPALVGNYATRTLIGREALCRSAANMSRTQLSEAVDALLSFDVVMTLDRSRDIDLLIPTMLGWPARNFSSQPASRVRDVGSTLAAHGVLSMALDQHEWSLLTQGSVQILKSSSASGSSGSAAASQGNALSYQDEDVDHEHEHETEILQEGQESADDESAVANADGGSDSNAVTAVFRRKGHMLPDLVPAGVSSTAAGFVMPGMAAAAVQVTTAGASMSFASMTVATGSEQQQQQQLNDYSDSGDSAAVMSDDDSYASQTGQVTGGDDMIINGEDGEQQGYLPNGLSGNDAFERAAAALDVPFEEQPPSPALPPEQLAIIGAVALVKSSWLERQAHRLGFPSISTAGNRLFPEPIFEYMDRKDQHGAHMVRVVSNVNITHSATEVWHAFPRHAFAFTEVDISRLEQLTHLDRLLLETADLLLDIDTVWLQSLMHNQHYRKKMKSLATTYTACGFSGMMALTDTVQDHVFGV